jgi:hypothetical protein
VARGLVLVVVGTKRLQCDLRNIFPEMDSGVNVFLKSLILLSCCLFVVVVLLLCLFVSFGCVWLLVWSFKLLLLSPDAMVAVRRRMRGFVVRSVFDCIVCVVV